MAQEVVKALLVEIDGNVEKLRKALRAGEADVKGFSEKASKSTTTVGASADVAANKFAGAARAGASAMETIARTGTASGEAMKQLIAQGSNAALFFGAGGAFVGAIGIATLAIAGMFARTREEMAETERRGVAAMNRLSELDQAGLMQQYQRGRTGTRFVGSVAGVVADPGLDRRAREDALDSFGLNRLEPALAELEAKRDRARAAARAQAVGGAAGTGVRGETAGLKEVEDQYDAVAASVARLAAQEKVLLQMQAEKAAFDLNTMQNLARLRGETKGLTEDERARQEALKELQRASVQLGETTQRLIAGEFATLEERVRAPFDAAIQRAHELARAGQDVGANLQRADGLAAARDVAVQTAVALEAADQAMQRFGASVVERGLPAESSLRELKGAADDLRDEMADLAEGSEPYLKLLEKLQQLEKELAEAQAKRAEAQRDVGAGNAPEAPKARDMADYAREVQQAADGALQLMQNLGGANAETIGLLRGIGQIAGNLPALQKALTPGKDGTPISGMGVLTASLPILGALTSILGSDPAEAARRQTLEENTEAIKALTAKAGQLGLGVSGSDAGSAADQLRAFIQRYGPGVRMAGDEDARRAAKAAGLSLTELDAIAEKHGITLNGSMTSFEQLADAIDATRMKLGEFGDDLDSQRRQADAEIAIRGITDPLERLAIRQGAYAGRSSALDGVTAGLDLSTAEGRAQARANAEALFAIMRAGGETLGEGALGGLTGDELLQALLDLTNSLDALDETAASANGSTLGAVSGYTGLSAAAGSRIEDYNRALVGYARDAQGTRLAMLSALEALVDRTLGPIPVPPLFADAGRGGGGSGFTLTIGELVVQVHVTAAGDARAIGAAAGAAFETGMEDAFARALIRARQATGDLSAGTA
jgi:hypothetical protein